MKKKSIIIAFAFIISSIQCLTVFAEAVSKPLDIKIETDQFTLLSMSEKFILQLSPNGKKKQIIIPREWLIPSEEEKAESGNYISSFYYDEKITSFPIGNGQIGLHISSFTSMTEGSAQAGAGRDVFLIYSPKSSEVSKGNINFGITKERGRYFGYLYAKASHFLLSDINKDGFIDIGVVSEKMECEVDAIACPFYVQSPIVWYIFKGGLWNYDSHFDGKFIAEYLELPLIEIIMTPVDFFASMEWNSYDPSKWNSRNRKPIKYKYMPAYRKKLIENDLKKHGR